MISKLKALLNSPQKQEYTRVIRLLNLVRAGKGENLDEIDNQIESFLNSSYWQVKNEAVKMIGILKLEKYILLLSGFLTDQNQVGFIRRNSAVALRAFDKLPDETLKALREACQDWYWEARTQAILTLVQYDDSPVTFMLCRDLLFNGNNSSQKVKEKNFEVQCAILQALGKSVRNPEDLKLLQPFLTHDSWKVRQAAILGLCDGVIKMKLTKDDFLNLIGHFDINCEEFSPTFPLTKTYNHCLQVLKEKNADS